MSIDKNKINLIHKQLTLIDKREEKLLKEKSSYFKNNISPLINKIEDSIPEKLQSVLESAFQKAFKTVFEKGSIIIEKTYNKDDIHMEYDINTYAINKYPTKKNLNKIDNAVNKKNLINKSLTIIEGTSLGILGVGLPDIPIYIGVILKSIYEISLSYGFDYTTPEEQAYILNIICASVTTGTERGEYFKKIDILCDALNSNNVVVANLNIYLIEASSKMSDYMITAKFIQGLPFVGVVGGLTNFLTLQSITTIAQLKYKKRYLNKLLLG